MAVSDHVDYEACSVGDCKHPVSVYLRQKDGDDVESIGMCVEHCRMNHICWGCGGDFSEDTEFTTNATWRIGLCRDCHTDFLNEDWCCIDETEGVKTDDCDYDY